MQEKAAAKAAAEEQPEESLKITLNTASLSGPLKRKQARPSFLINFSVLSPCHALHL